MFPIAITPPSTNPNSRSDSPTLDSTSRLTKAGIQHAHQSVIPPSDLSSHSTIPAPLLASLLTIQRTTNPLPYPSPSSPELLNQRAHTDHILLASYSDTLGWSAPTITPYSNLSLSPLSSVLHYATTCFEGMKAYRGVDGRIRLFRPARNAARFRRSAERIALPGVDEKEFGELVKTFIAVEGGRWLPKEKEEDGRGGWRFKERMLYLRPTMMGTGEALGVQRPKEGLLMVVAVVFPDLDETSKEESAANGTGANGVNGVGNVDKVNEKSSPGVSGRGMRLLASSHDMIRAWPGGFGNAKVGANYGPSLVAQGEARARGYQQILWLFGKEGFVTEAGGSNFFVIWRNRQGERELVTAPLGDGVILEGVTRASVLELAGERLGDVKVVERNFTMDEMVLASEEGRLEEAFACGTAFFIAPVSEIHFRGMDVVLPVGREDAVGNDGKEMTMKIKGWLKDIMYGREEHEWGVVVDEVDG